jgi:hypothetical protein
MNARVKFLLSMMLLMGGPTAWASYLRMMPAYEVHVDRQNKKVTIQWTVTNQGDESAKEVGLDFPSLNEVYPIAQDLAPRGQARWTLKLPFSRLGISRRGSYALVYRVNYKDANLYPFSAPSMVWISLPPELSSLLSIRRKRAGGELGLHLFSQVKVSVGIHNQSYQEVIVDRAELMAPLELHAAVQENLFPKTLNPGENADLTISLSPTEALVGSVYMIGIVVSGTSGDAHFSEPMTFPVRIKDRSFNPRNVIFAGLGLLGVGLIVNEWRKNRASKRSTSPRSRPPQK